MSSLTNVVSQCLCRTTSIWKLYFLFPIIRCLWISFQTLRNLTLFPTNLGFSSIKDTFGDVDFNNIPFVHDVKNTPERSERDQVIQRLRNKSVFSSTIIGLDWKQFINIFKARDVDIYVEIVQLLPVSCW